MSLVKHIWPFLILGLLLFGAQQLVSSHRKEAEKAGNLEKQVEHLEQVIADEVAITEAIEASAAGAREAVVIRDKAVAAVRESHEEARQTVRAGSVVAAAADCRNQPVAADIDGLLRAAGAP